ncbi:hypothetical protein PoB_001724400 [Plakobranchus ocellatus]|uniref:Uncharacterized protein n=1 Tax=Plakobranchus ocellatus TaxID=259542 RepID=A0AAV3Z8J2_9GAST|nr:hypothetical protein PoB_001724400 [Plakobranchus ocellatus]
MEMISHKSYTEVSSVRGSTWVAIGYNEMHCLLACISSQKPKDRKAAYKASTSKNCGYTKSNASRTSSNTVTEYLSRDRHKVIAEEAKMSSVPREDGQKHKYRMHSVRMAFCNVQAAMCSEISCASFCVILAIQKSEIFIVDYHHKYYDNKHHLIYFHLHDNY